MKRLKAHPRENPKILSKQENWLLVSDFNAFRDPDEKVFFEPKTRIVSEEEQLTFKIANMTIENLQEDVRSQIKRAKTDKAIELIEQWAIAHNEESIKKEIAKIQGDWRRLKTDDMQGTIDSNEKEIRMNKIHVKLLNIKDMSKSSNDVNEPVMPHNNPIPEPNDWYGITFSLVCVGALAAGAIGVLPFEKALLWMVAVIFLFMVVGIFQLSNANKLSQENFMLWMKMFFAKIPGLSFFSEKKMNN